MREKARAEGRPPRYDGRWRDRDPSEAPEDVKPAIRLKAPAEGETVVEDHVQGRVVWQNKDLDDLILLRSDGNPTYMLAVVVDDHDMGVTHIVRGDDHLTNAARQTHIYQAMGWPVPEMAHIPLIHGPDGAKLSKRHGALGVEAYRAMGYLPQAMRNYLVRLGWSHGDDEVMSMEQMLEWFDLDAIGKSAARFDFAKLENLNGLYMRQTPDDELFSVFLANLAYLPGGPEFEARLDDTKSKRLAQAMPGLKERAKNLVDLLESALFLVEDRPLQMQDKALKILDESARKTLAEVAVVLSETPNWDAASLESAVKRFAEATDRKLGSIAQPLRAALTGRATSPGIFDVLAVLGREESLARIGDQAS